MKRLIVLGLFLPGVALAQVTDIASAASAAQADVAASIAKALSTVAGADAARIAALQEQLAKEPERTAKAVSDALAKAAAAPPAP